MPSSFFELSVASTGLFTSKGALNVTSHNIANAATTGYSRQVALIKARTPLNYQNGRGMVGTGSEIYGVGQIRNVYIDAKYWTTTGRLGEYTAKNTQNMLMQAVLNETEDSGFNVVIDKFFKTLSSDLSTDSGDMTARLNVVQTASSLCTFINSAAMQLEKQQADINSEIESVVSQINNLGVQIQNLNKQIFASEIGGQQANDLRDQRALVVDELSRYVNVDVKEMELNKDLLTGESEKRYQVSINGYDFVNHFSMNPLNCVERAVGSENNPGDAKGLYDIYWDSGIKFNSEFSLASMGGELKGLLQVRDGNNKANNNKATDVDYKGIPYFMTKLDNLARGLASAFNYGRDLAGNALFDNGFEGHYNCYNMIEGDNTGYNFFSFDGNLNDRAEITNLNQITAKNFCVSQTLLDDPNALAAAWKTSNPDISDNTGLLQLLSLKHNPQVFAEGEIGNFIESIIGELGIVASESVAFESNYTDIQAAIQNQRLAVSSVDLNEEVTMMIQLQQMYNACAKLISVLNSIYDTTINKLG